MTKHVARRWTPLAAAIFLATGNAEATPPATITVTDGGDAGTAQTCTLRQAIDVANGASVTSACATAGASNEIRFAAALAGATVTLAQGQLTVSRSMAIIGSGETIDAAGGSRVLYVANVPLDLSGLTLTGGVADADYGGGILLAGASVYARLTNCHVSGNSAQFGAGIAVRQGAGVTITNCVIHANTGTSGPVSASTGGGVFSTGSSVALIRSTVDGNAAGDAAVAASDGSLLLLDAGVSGNDAGGVRAANTVLVASNVTIAGNASSGARIYDGPATFANATIAGNTDPDYGGVGVFGSTTLTLQNSIVANNGKVDCYLYSGGAQVSASHTLIGNAASSCGITGGSNGNLVGVDPVLLPLADNGGPTQTMALGIGATPGDPTSPALGAGSVALATIAGAPLQYDQRGVGFARTLGGQVDMGAWQNQDGRIFVAGFEPDDAVPGP